MAVKKKKQHSKGVINQTTVWLVFCSAIGITPLVASTGGNAFMEIYLPTIILSIVCGYIALHYWLNQKLEWTYSVHWLFWSITGLLIWGLLSSLWSTNAYLALDLGLRWLSAWLGLIVVVHLICQQNNINKLYQCLSLIHI